MSFFDLIKGSASKTPERVLPADVHSHLLPGIDDGSQSMDESMELISQMAALGYHKAITTPHIIQDYFPNTPEIIRAKLKEVRAELVNRSITFELDAAAEYYLDEFLMDRVNDKEDLLTFGKDYLLFEMAFISESPFLNQLIFDLKTSGIQPILAHAERYSYYYGKVDSIAELVDRGCLIQLNINSLVGHYGKGSQKLGEKLIDDELVHLLGTDCHSMHHLDLIKKAQNSKYYQKALNLPLINYSI